MEKISQEKMNCSHKPNCLSAEFFSYKHFFDKRLLVIYVNMYNIDERKLFVGIQFFKKKFMLIFSYNRK